MDGRMDGWMAGWSVFKKFIDFFCFKKLGVRSKKNFNLDQIFIKKGGKLMLRFYLEIFSLKLQNV
jgi:hypothetical protein